MAIPDSEIISSYKKKLLQDPCLKLLKRKMNTKEFSPPMAKTYNLLKHILDQYDQEIADSNLDAIQEFVKVEESAICVVCDTDFFYYLIKAV